MIQRLISCAATTSITACLALEVHDRRMEAKQGGLYYTLLQLLYCCATGSPKAKWGS